MKKVSIITLHSVHNYGSVLQAYAAARLFELAGAEPELVDFRRKENLPQNLLQSWLADSPRWNRGRAARSLFQVIKAPSLKRQNQVFGSFLQQSIPLTKTRYTSLEQLIEQPPKADLYCTGGDQVFNSLWWKELEPAYYLPWAPQGANRISLSSSFGRDTLEPWEREAVAGWLSQYKLLSFRERSGVEIAHQLGRQDAVCLLDPVLLLPPEEWERFAQEPHQGYRYVLLYQLSPNPHMEQEAATLAKQNRWDLVRISTFYDQIRKQGKLICCPSPEEFAGLFRFAGAVVTDSFHGAAFSLLFHKPFRVFLSNRFPERLQNLLEMAGLSAINSGSGKQAGFTSGWEQIEQVLEQEREKGKDFLKQALELGQ